MKFSKALGDDHELQRLLKKLGIGLYPVRPRSPPTPSSHLDLADDAQFSDCDRQVPQGCWPVDLGGASKFIQLPFMLKMDGGLRSPSTDRPLLTKKGAKDLDKAGCTAAEAHSETEQDKVAGSLVPPIAVSVEITLFQQWLDILSQTGRVSRVN